MLLTNTLAQIGGELPLWNKNGEHKSAKEYQERGSDISFNYYTSKKE